MNQKAFVAIFVGLLLIAITTVALNQLSNKSKDPEASTAPTGNVFESPSPSAQSNNNGLPPELQDPPPGGQAAQKPNQQQQQQQAQQRQQQMMAQPTLAPGKKQYTAPPPTLSAAELANKKAVIETPKGTIEFEIFTDSPKAASNFIFLTNEGFYDGLKFHRVVPGFVIQGGDPIGNGTGGPGYKFEDEKVTKKYNKGIVAMANAGPNTNGSQFFIMLDDNPDLPPNYTIFGKVLTGQDVVDQIKVGDLMTKVSIEPLK